MIADAVLLMLCLANLAGMAMAWWAIERLTDRIEWLEDWRAIQLHGGNDERT